MPLSPTEREVFEEACANRQNEAAITLLNLFASKSAADVLEQILLVPPKVRPDVMEQVRKAIEEQRRARFLRR